MSERMRPGAAFAGRIGRTVADSVPGWEDYLRPAASAPNIVVIVLDDVGFGQLSRFGGSARTPAMDSIGEDGLTYTDFHVTSLCSPSRASLLTGRNHHSVGMGFLAGFDSGFPSYRGRIDPSAATVATMLRAQGYATFAVGKWHLVPGSDMGAAGPFDHWPLRKGFDRFYGFHWGEDDQFTPQLFVDDHFHDPPARAGYHLTEDLVDQASQMIGDHLSAGQDRPFFLYLALGAGHAPHQAPAEYLERQRGRFDHGWDLERERVLERQCVAGIVSEDTELGQPNPGVAAWTDLPPTQQRLYARFQEAFAAFMEHTDDQVRRLLDFLDEQRVTDDTLVVLLSDNGASGEGGEHGIANEYRAYMKLGNSLDDNLALIDELGGPGSHSNYPAGWAQAGNTPLRYYKRFMHAGGVRAPLMMKWPTRITDRGAIRHTFSHIIDIAPTLLDAASVTPSSTYEGVVQQPIHGRSLLPTIDSDPEFLPERRTQHFEVSGSRGIIHEGWKAVTIHPVGASFDDAEWSLFRRDDVAERHDLAGEHPDVISELDALWWQEAERFDVLPLHDLAQVRMEAGGATGRRHWRLLPGTRIFSSVAGPDWADRSFAISTTARLTPGDEGVILAVGKRAAGFSFYVQDGQLVFEYNRAGDRSVIVGAAPLPTGVVHLAVIARQGENRTAEVTLSVDGVAVASERIPTMAAGGGLCSTQVGHNAPSAVSTRYDPPFTFSGTLSAVEVFFDEEAEPFDLSLARIAD